MKIFVKFEHGFQVWFQEIDYDKWKEINTFSGSWHIERDDKGRWYAHYRRSDASQLLDGDEGLSTFPAMELQTSSSRK